MSIKIISLLILLCALSGPVQGQEKVTGTVFYDLNTNGRLDPGEHGIPGVLVSNGRDIEATGADGRYRVPARDETIITLIKPSGWTTEVDENGIPRFYYIHAENGAGGSEFPGVEPTGPLPESVDFALQPQEESDAFRVLIFGDTQARDLDEVGYVAHDSVQELIGVDAAFGATLGDLVFDDLDVLRPLTEVVGQIGVPWRHIIGNHDIDFSADRNHDARGAYHQMLGPSHYAFTRGKTHFVVVDNIRWIVDGED
ncbi:MAG: metallophosphoesterase N-terminal domain-containing protein, partial [Balneolales bacterium]